MVVTYQSTIEDRDWLNNERNVLTEYNCSEAEGLARPARTLYRSTSRRPSGKSA